MINEDFKLLRLLGIRVCRSLSRSRRSRNIGVDVLEQRLYLSAVTNGWFSESLADWGTADTVDFDGVWFAVGTIGHDDFSDSLDTEPFTFSPASLVSTDTFSDASGAGLGWSWGGDDAGDSPWTDWYSDEPWVAGDGTDWFDDEEWYADSELQSGESWFADSKWFSTEDWYTDGLEVADDFTEVHDEDRPEEADPFTEPELLMDDIGAAAPVEPLDERPVMIAPTEPAVPTPGLESEETVNAAQPPKPDETEVAVEEATSDHDQQTGVVITSGDTNFFQIEIDSSQPGSLAEQEIIQHLLESIRQTGEEHPSFEELSDQLNQALDEAIHTSLDNSPGLHHVESEPIADHIAEQENPSDPAHDVEESSQTAQEHHEPREGDDGTHQPPSTGHTPADANPATQQAQRREEELIVQPSLPSKTNPEASSTPLVKRQQQSMQSGASLVTPDSPALVPVPSPQQSGEEAGVADEPSADASKIQAAVAQASQLTSAKQHRIPVAPVRYSSSAVLPSLRLSEAATDQESPASNAASDQEGQQLIADEGETRSGASPWIVAAAALGVSGRSLRQARLRRERNQRESSGTPGRHS